MVSSAEDRPEAGGAGGEPSDHWLLQQFQEGNQEAATEIYTRYAHRLRALAKAQCSPVLQRCLEADDIVQSVFRSFFRRAQHGVYDVPSDGELWRLLLVITLNKVRAKGEYFRAAKRDARLAKELSPDTADRPQASSEPGSYLQLAVEDALERLPEHHRPIVELRIQGCDVAEIAEKTQRAKRTVERVLQLFRESLKEILDEDQ